MNHDDLISNAEAPGISRPPRPPFVALNSRFLRRTAWASLVTTLLVALTVAVYWSPLWSTRYLFSGLWALVFFSLTPLILKAFMFDGRSLRGLALLGLKLVWMGLMFVVCSIWPLAEGREILEGSALVAGVTTPLFVVTLRAIGAMTQQNNFAPDQTPASESALHKSTESNA